MGSTEEIVDLEVAQLKMKKWRDEGYRNSDEIIELGESLLSDYASKLGEEIWVLFEQVCKASLDCNRMDLADTCIHALDKQFPASKRVMILRAMQLEAEDQHLKALDIYNNMLGTDPANLLARKRKISIFKDQNKIDETIEELNEYLEMFMGDQEAWMELCELYINQQDFSKAAFCMEELILSHPHNHLYHQRFAEIHYTMGSMNKAKKYFAQALQLDPNNVRALYGLYLATSNLTSSKNSTESKQNQKMSSWTADKALDLFGVNVSEDQKKTLTQMFDNMQLALPSNN